MLMKEILLPHLTATSLVRSPCYFDHFILAPTKVRSVIFLFKEPLLYGHPVNTVRFLWPVSDSIYKRGWNCGGKRPEIGVSGVSGKKNKTHPNCLTRQILSSFPEVEKSHFQSDSNLKRCTNSSNWNNYG